MRIVTLNKHDLYLTYSWNKNRHGICGHTYEAIEYYMIISKFFNCGLFFVELDKELLESTIRSKYDFTEEEIQNIIDNSIFNVGELPTLIKAQNILFVDGSISTINTYTLLVDNIFMFACGDKLIQYNTNNKIFILQDDRVYDKVDVNGINYIKKILFHRFKQSENVNNRTLIYATENCRLLTDNDIRTIFNRDENFLVIANDITKYLSFQNVLPMVPPISNIFSQFNKYLYTPVARQFDCSPRFIAECKYLNKEVEYFKIDYLDIDLGLKYRIYDIENNFESLFLTEDDQIINILKEKINVKFK